MTQYPVVLDHLDDEHNLHIQKRPLNIVTAVIIRYITCLMNARKKTQ